MRELSIFVDESGSDGLSDRHYLLTVVMHDQSESIADSIAAYEGALRAKVFFTREIFRNSRVISFGFNGIGKGAVPLPP